ncbi:MAG: cytochrome b/b6 domain-containing protein [Alphaproteobacteria bacterium]
MSLMHRVRAYHATLATLTILAFMTGDFGLIHDWLGYAVAVIIVFRLLWALLNPRQLGLNRFYPNFEGLAFDTFTRHPGVSQTLILGIAITLIGATVTGLLLDSASEDGFMEDIHEAFSNLVVVMVILHAAYLMLFKWPLAKFMLYRDRRQGSANRPPDE